MLKNNTPILPLRDIVVFPHMIEPLFVGRKLSVNALNHVLTEDKKILLICPNFSISTIWAYKNVNKFLNVKKDITKIIGMKNQ